MDKEGIFVDQMMPQFQLARAYVPFQAYVERWPPMVGLERGTIFPELYRPYVPYRK
ncbi:MAG TPA: spore coat associated protein CotJA [Firmicutes bacterium]|nr:spore coat associated protein CotJA [Bacillota bacterium]HOQ23071.1 spore coat associated protein CotJA [Bacillota bacterium]HPT66969.1 spore coat associated protein CotJA [Bacillota bacterium]